MRIRNLAMPALILGVVSSTVRCSWWTRFDDLKDTVPVVEIANPGGIHGFATTMSTVPTDRGTRLMVLGEPNLVAKAAAWEIVNDDPPASPNSSGFCVDERCLFGDAPAPLKSFDFAGGTHPACFVLGVGDRDNTLGLVGTCADGEDFVLDVPTKVAAWGNSVVPPEQVIREDLTRAALGQPVVGDFKYDASAEDKPLIVAATKYIGASWFYAPGTTAPMRITPFAKENELPEDPRVRLGDTFGSEVAVTAVGTNDYLVAISAPRGVGNDMNGRVWLYRVVNGQVQGKSANPDVPAPIGCLPGYRSNFGIFMHSGPLFGGASKELLISDGMEISIYDAGVLANNPPTSDCSGPPLGNTGYVTGVKCVDTSSIRGCAFVTSDFGRSVAFADVDGNGANELVVGAPMLDVGGTQNSGAVLIYSVDPTGRNTRMLEARVLSSRDTADVLGTSVAALRIGTRDVIAAGAPGLGSFFLFYCSTIGGAGKSSSRCR